MLVVASAAGRYLPRGSGAAASAFDSTCPSSVSRQSIIARRHQIFPDAYDHLRGAPSQEVGRRLRLDQETTERYLHQLHKKDLSDLRPACTAYDDVFWLQADLPPGNAFARRHVRTFSGGYGWQAYDEMVNCGYPPLLMEYDFREHIQEWNVRRHKKEPVLYIPPHKQQQRRKQERQHYKGRNGNLAEFWQEENGLRETVLGDIVRTAAEVAAHGSGGSSDPDPPYPLLALNLRPFDIELLSEMLGEHTCELHRVEFAGLTPLQNAEAKGLFLKWMVREEVVTGHEDFAALARFAEDSGGGRGCGLRGGTAADSSVEFALQCMDHNRIVFEPRRGRRGKSSGTATAGTAKKIRENEVPKKGGGTSVPFA